MPSSTCPLQIHNEHGRNRKQPRVSYSLIINKTGLDQGHISTNLKKEKGGKRCPIPLFNINYIMFFHLSSEKDCSPHLVFYELNPKSIFLEYLGACLMGTESERRDFGTTVTHAGRMSSWQDHLHVACKGLILSQFLAWPDVRGGNTTTSVSTVLGRHTLRWGGNSERPSNCAKSHLSAPLGCGSRTHTLTAGHSRREHGRCIVVDCSITVTFALHKCPVT